MDIAVDKIAAFIDHARQFDVKEGMSDPDSGSNGIDDGMTDVLSDDADDAVQQELASFIAGLNEDEQADLVALVWLGRGDFDAQEWSEAFAQARERREGPTARYLLAIPNVGDLVEEGLAMMTELEDLPPSREAEERSDAPHGLHPEQDEERSGPDRDSDAGEPTPV